MRNAFIQIAILGLYISACSNHKPENINRDVIAQGTLTASPITSVDTIPSGKLISKMKCGNDSSQSYALYIPFIAGKKKLPAMYFFDPHADGSLPLSKYQALADKYGFILIGSNNSKNGNDYSMAENIWQHLFADTRTRMTIDTSRIYACGFSGGAKTAGYIALNHPEIKAVIANSAALPEGTPLQNFNFSFTGLAGNGDMNMTTVVDFCKALDKTNTAHRIILFNGKHEWAPATAMNIAFEGLVLDAMRNKQIAVDLNFIGDYISESKKKINFFIDQKDFIKAGDECKLSINLLQGISPAVHFFEEKQSSIIASPVYQQQLKRKEDLFAEEEKMKGIYEQQFQAGDIQYWQKTITGLNERAKAKTDEGAMHSRLLAYLSLAFYSLSNRFIQSGQNDGAAYFVTLYKMADPVNSEAWYFSAILNARKNNSRGTENDLLKAVSLGYHDKERMRMQQEFQSLRIDYAGIESKMKN
ncbi:MAG: hypothetical protein JST47_01090 [Bacteroidetes bacterium]|nr:hypothetical protein [Bacteroidota bacterium]MBS1973180.1 hypothetical protein [Bacteroidota bacterium]